ncbi:hypothetical protein AAFF_G00058470 [Aldrovandia affinis]|uniref:Uncharacterized protein n=1 Tax=Aldrovandia affinis TaxID=143900 RepID=A0AAD7WEA6_9TELE|nr:hypothetical protein AAFF_G00058470 [Aldrovandia affinis]
MQKHWHRVARYSGISWQHTCPGRPTPRGYRIKRRQALAILQSPATLGRATSPPALVTKSEPGSASQASHRRAPLTLPVQRDLPSPVSSRQRGANRRAGSSGARRSL